MERGEWEGFFGVVEEPVERAGGVRGVDDGGAGGGTGEGDGVAVDGEGGVGGDGAFVIGGPHLGVHLRFGDDAFVVDLVHPIFDGRAHGEEAVVLRGIRSEIVDFVGVGVEIVQFFGRFGGGEEEGGGAGKFAFSIEPSPFLHDGGVFHVLVDLGIGEIGAEVFGVTVLAVAGGALHVDGFVHAIAGGEDVFRFGLGAWAEDDAALHLRRDFGAGQGDEGRAEVHESDEVGADGTSLEMAGPADEEGDTEAGVIGPALAAREAAAVVAPEEDDGIVGEAVSLELIEDVLNLLVHDSDAIVVACPIGADDGGIGIVGGNIGLGGVVFFGEGIGEVVVLVIDVHGTGFVRGLDVEDGEERLGFVGAIAPVGLLVALIPGGTGGGKVVVGLGVVGAVIAGEAEVFGEAADIVGGDDVGAVVLAADGGGVHAGDDGVAAGGTDGSGGEGAVEADAFGGEAVEVGGGGVIVAVTVEIGADVFGGDPEEVRPGGGRGGEGGKGEKKER